MSSDSDPGRWELLQGVFHAAADLSPEECGAYLDVACAGDSALREEVEQLLALDVGGEFTLARQAVHDAASGISRESEEAWIGRRVGAWRVTGVLGRGGMGAVYEVERDDGAYRQRAALKVMRRELTVLDGARRFAEERQILAQLEHPNIARLLDGGNSSDGVPFLVLELVEGKPIHEFARDNQLTLAQRLRLVATVAEAVHAAHRKLIIHRDLKPSNILVTSDGTVKLLDFGIARLLDPALPGSAASSTDLLFSPAYASPEQVTGEDVSTATDVFSLGAVLFELLAGSRPRRLEAASLEEIRDSITRHPIPVPSTLAPAGSRRSLRGDLDAIVGLATRLNPAERYQSAEQFAADIGRYLFGRTVLARPSTAAYRAAKIFRRHALAAVLATVAVAGLVAATVNATIHARRAERRLAQVRHLANVFLFEFHDQIRDLQGSTLARESVVRTGLTYLQGLAAEGHTDRDLSLEVAAAYDRVGALQYLPGAASLGRPAEAQISYRKAIDLRRRWIDREPSNAVLHRLQAESYLNLAAAETSLLGLERVTESYTRGLDHAERARRLSRPPTREVLALLARMYRSRATLAARGGDLQGSVDDNRAALRIHEDLAAGGSDPELRLAAAESHSRLALSLYNDGRQREADAEFQTAVREFEQISLAYPDDRRYRRALFSSYFVYGGVLTNSMLGIYNPAQAHQLFETALDLARQMAKDTADANASRDLAIAHCQYGSTLADTDPAAAVREYEEGICILRQLSAQSPEQRGLQMALLLHLPSYAEALAATGRRSAITEARRAVAIAESLVQADPKALQGQRLLLGASAGLAHVYLAFGEYRNVTLTLTSVLPIAENGELSKISQSLLGERIGVYSLLARAATKMGDGAQAAAWKSRFDAAIHECSRRGLDGPFAARQRHLLW